MKASRKNGKRSIALGIDQNPAVTKADFIPAKAAKGMKKGKKGVKVKYMAGGKYKMAGKGMKYEVGGSYDPRKVAKMKGLEAKIKEAKGTPAVKALIEEYRKLTGTK